MNQNLDIMVDIETFSTSQNAAIVSIGAVAFNAGGENGELFTNSPDALATLGQGFRVNVDLSKTPPSLRGDIDPATVEWWLQQSDEARGMLVNGGANPRRGLGVALGEFAEWVRRQGSHNKLRLWSNGPTFDEIILRSAFVRFGIDFPVHFRGSRCCRTIYDLATSFGWDPKAAAAAVAMGGPSDLVKHDALSDAVFQARGVVSMQHFLRLTVNVAGQPKG